MKELISKFDTSNQLEVLAKSFEQIEYAWQNDIPLKAEDYLGIEKIIICGMGGSAIGGDIFSNLFQENINLPIIVNRNYDLPVFADSKTLVVISSYSGNTEESVSAFLQALNKRCKIISLSTGGKVEELCTAHKLPVIKLKKGFHPRFALYMISFTLIKVFQTIKFIDNQDNFVKEAIDLLKERAKEYSLDNSYPQKLALDLLGFIPVIYVTTDLNNSAGFRLKGQFNENSKLHAFCNVLPEMNHNEIIGWETNLENIFKTKAIFISDVKMHQRIKARFEIVESLIKSNGTEIIKLESDKKSFALRLYDIIFLGDWITYYLAVLRKKDPAEIEYINVLKEKLNEIKI